MDDLIRREDALDAIYGVVTTVSVCLTAEEAKIRTDTRKRCEDAVASVPAVDAVEVVRCKDCAWGIPHPASATVVCGNFGIRRKERAYCSMGRRRDGGENHVPNMGSDRRADFCASVSSLDYNQNLGRLAGDGGENNDA